MARLLFRLLPWFAFIAVCLPQGDAHARRGIVLITSGDSISHVAELDSAVAEEIEAEVGSGIAVGYKYEQFGLFWLEIWSWDGEYVLYRGDDYWDLPPDELMAAAGVSSFDELPKPWTYTLPPGLIAIGVLGIGLLIFALVSRGDDEDAEEDDVDDTATDRPDPTGPEHVAGQPAYPPQGQPGVYGQPNPPTGQPSGPPPGYGPQS